MSEDTAVALVVLEHASPATRRLLCDAGCSYIDGSGHQWIREVSGAPTEIPAGDAQRIVEEMVHLVLAGEIGGALLARSSFEVSDAPHEVAVVLHPIELLEWLTQRREAAAMHPGAKAYLYASDPDDILAKLPFHHRAEDDDPPESVKKRKGTLLAAATLVFSEGRLQQVRFGEARSVSGFDGR